MQLFRRTPPNEAETYFNQGLRYHDRRKKEFNFDLAIEYFKEAIKLEPEIGKYRTALGKAYVAAPLLAVTRGIGDGLVLSESPGLAIDELNRAIQIYPGQVEAYLVLGEAYLYMGKKQKAKDAFQDAINAASLSFSILSPFSFIDSRLLKSFAKRRLKQLEQGTDKQPQPDAAQGRIRQAIAYREEGKYNLAEKELMQAFSLAPDWAWLHKAMCKLVS